MSGNEEHLGKAIAAALSRIRPEPQRIEIEEKLWYELLRLTEWSRDIEPARGFDDDWKFQNVPVKVRRYLKGWRVVGTEETGVYPSFVQTTYAPIERPKPMTIESDNFDEQEAMRYEAAREQELRRRSAHLGHSISTGTKR